MSAVAPPTLLEDTVVTILEEAGPLTDAEILLRSPNAGDVEDIRRVLLADRRFAPADANRWFLAKREPVQELQLFDVSVPDAVASRKRGRRRRSLKERAEMCFLEIGHPLHLQALANRIGNDVNVESLKTQLSADDSFMRNDISEWALTRWGMRRYTSVRELVADEVDQAGGSIPLVDLERNLARNFTIKSSTLRQMASTAPFETSAGTVRRLNPDRSQTGQRLHVAGAVDASADEIIDLMGLS